MKKMAVDGVLDGQVVLSRGVGYINLEPLEMIKSKQLADSLHVRNSLEELLLITGQADRIPVDTIIRKLRPMTHDMREFSNALRQKIKQSILTRPGGAMLAAKFDKACESYKRLEGKNLSILPSFLAIFGPLVFSPLVCTSTPERLPPPPSSGLTRSLETTIVSGKPSSALAPPARSMTASVDLHDAMILSSTPLPSAAITQITRASNVPDALLPAPVTTSLLRYEDSEREEDAEVLEQFREAMESVWMSPELEVKLIRDLLFVFQGIAGRHIKFDPRSEQYVVDPGLPIKSTVKDLVLSLCELGWLYTKVEVYIQRAEADRFRGLVMHALGFALQEELHDYYRLLAVLEQELGRRVKLLQSDHQNKGGSSSGLTLMRLRAWVAEPLERMYLMARIVESAAPLTGGALASRLHGHCKHGDPTVRVFTLRLMTSVCAPLNAIITRWLLHGELQDGHREFFIGSNIDNVAMGVQSEDAWHKLYYLDYAMLPSFISVDLASRILVIGKSIGFIRMCVLNLGHMSEERPPSKQRGVKMARESVSSALRGLNTNKDGSLVMDSPLTLVTDTTHLMAELFARGKELNECLQGLLDFGGNLRLSSLLEEISTSIDRKLLNMMESRYYLSTHLSSLKKFMLLGQGDFVTCLMDALGPELKKKATLLYRHNLTGILEGALRASNAQFEPGYVLERVGVRLLDASPGDTGWEVFTLDYHIDSPLSAVVHPGAMIQYRSAFNMLWKLKRLEWSLSASWKQLMSFNHMRGSVVVPKLKAILHHCSLSRARMMHVVNNLCAFMQFEVIESAWSNFNAALMSAQRLDDVISAHDAYLADIHKRALLDAYHESFNVQVQLLLQAMLRFCSLEESLIADAMASIARRRALLSDIKTRSQKREERFEDDDVDSEANVTTPGRDGNMTGYLIQKLDESVVEFSGNFDRILAMLTEQGDKEEEISRFLTFRLDYNDFYANMAEHGGGSQGPFSASNIRRISR